MLGPAARMAASSSPVDEEEKTAQPAVAKAGRRAGRDRTTATTPSNAKSTGNFMSSPRSTQIDSPTDSANDDTLLKPSRRAPPPSTAEDNSPPLSPASPQQKVRGRVGDSLASEAEAAMGLDEPPPQPKTAGWGSASATTVIEDNSKANVQSPSGTQPSQQPAFGRRNAPATATTSTTSTAAAAKPASIAGKHDVADEITDITEIPDLEDDGKQDITLTVAANTHARSHTVQALNELDRQLEGKNGLGGSGGAGGEGGMPALLLNGGEVDVSLLLGVLCGVAGVDEGDGVWEFDALFSEVSSDMYAEMEHQEGEDEGAEEGDGGTTAAEKAKAAQAPSSKRPSITAK